MLDFTPEQLQRWDEWQLANAIGVRRHDRIARLVGLVMFATALSAMAAAIWGAR